MLKNTLGISLLLLLTTDSEACRGVDPHSLKLYVEKNDIAYEEGKLVEKCEELPPVRVVAYFPKLENSTSGRQVIWAMDGLGILEDAVIIEFDEDSSIHSKFGCSGRFDEEFKK